MSYNRHHVALVFLSTVFAFAACSDAEPLPTGLESSRTGPTAQWVEFHVFNGSPWDLKLHIEGAHTVSLGHVSTRSRDSFAVDMAGLGAAAVRIRADAPGRVLYSDYFEAIGGSVNVTLDRDGGIQVEPVCDLRTDDCRF